MAGWLKPFESLVFITVGILVSTAVFKRGLPDLWDVVTAAVMATWVEMWLMWREKVAEKKEPPA